ncbi:tyrosine-type recombinase/integrase [Nocardioides bruguierae]|uniref:tyrosine-type recombinase/integrase n=1 Tax=Nocardioides bruguierae TaxID=2945102 RepID=UPI002020D84A|nr:tyrosine-type recombinase/integrase [Nocardioides bruguierae]MCL8026293.1 tyrosine-type recombinase/integrase [Nocardioides bruguierae]
MPHATALRGLYPSWTLAMEAENKSPRTVRGYLDSLELFARWLEDNQHPVLPEDITTALLRTWLVELTETRSASTSRTRWNGLRSFFAWAAEEQEIPANPMERVKAPALPEKIIPMLKVEELKAIIDACDGPLMIDRRDQALILMYADTGARRSELAAAQVEDLDLRERTLRVTGKGRRDRVLPFGARTARAVDRYLRLRARWDTAEGPWLWISERDGAPLSSDAIRQMIRRRGEQAGVKGAHAHQFRHGFADAWLRSGGSEGDLMELTGWRSRQMVTRYAAATRAERAREAYKARSPMDNL